MSVRSVVNKVMFGLGSEDISTGEIFEIVSQELTEEDKDGVVDKFIFNEIKKVGSQASSNFEKENGQLCLFGEADMQIPINIGDSRYKAQGRCSGAELMLQHRRIQKAATDSQSKANAYYENMIEIIEKCFSESISFEEAVIKLGRYKTDSEEEADKVA